MGNNKVSISSEVNLTQEELLVLLKEQKEVIKSIQKEEKKYRGLFDNAVDGIYRSTSEGRFIEVNTALVKMLGYNSKEELLAINIKKDLYFDINDRDLIDLDENQEDKCIIQLRKKCGSPIWVEDSGKIVTDTKGNIIFHDGILRDVSEKMKVAKIQNVLLNISKGSYITKKIEEFNILVHQELGKIIDVSNFYIALYNKKKQTINIPFISGEVASEDFPIGKSMTGYLIKNKKPFFLKSKDYKKLIDDGEIELIGKFPEVWLGVPLKVDDNVIGAIVVQSYHDPNAYQFEDLELLEFVSSHISLAIQRKRDAQEIVISKQVLRKVLDNIPIKVFWKNKKSQFLGCNSAFLKENSFENENDVIGKTDFDFNDKNEAEKYRADDVETMLSGKPKINYQESMVVNGKERWITTSKLPFFNKENEVIGIIGTSENITLRKENELELKKATDEAIAANLSKSTFLSNMSHEIRTPMNAILGYSQLLQDDDNLTKAQHENLKTINRSGEHLLALINDVLDMSKIEAGRISLKKSHFNFLELIKEVEQLFKIRASQKNLDLQFKIDDSIPKVIFADESKIKQVIINLLGNAIKFTPDGYIYVNVNKTLNNKIEVIVKDSGKGIAKEEQKVIFKPFEQAQIGGQTRGGTGLGLAISKKFAQLMGGDISIESEFGKGSAFNFNFEFENSEEDNLEQEIEELQVLSLTPEMKGLKVAIVDDRFENRDILEKKLVPLGFDTRMAENGLEAVKLYKEWKPDIVLMDVVMPVMNGVEATRQILNLSGSHDVKIFVVSASAMESEQKEVMEIGATVFIKKPVIFKLLLSEMHLKGGVQYLYKDKKEISSINDSVKASDVSEVFKNKLFSAASEGDFMLLQDLLNDLEKETNKSFKFIEESINEMEFESIIKWLKS